MDSKEARLKYLDFNIRLTEQLLNVTFKVQTVEEKEAFCAHYKEQRVQATEKLLSEVDTAFRLKVFRMDDYQWIAHFSAEEALAYYHKMSGVPMNELQENFDSWGEVPLTDIMYWDAADLSKEEKDMPGVRYVGENTYGDTYEVPFSWVIQNRTHLYPGFIACTE